MVLEVTMPALSPTMTEGKIVNWNKNEGDNIETGDVLLEVETDKAVMEVEAQDKGVIGKILYNLNDNVEVGKVIALILEKGETVDDIKDYKVGSNKNDNVEMTSEDENNVNNKNEEKYESQDKVSNVSCLQSNQENNYICSCNDRQTNKVFSSPLARNVAKINNIDINDVAKQGGTGPNGRIIKDDVLKFLSSCASCNCFASVGRNSVEYTDVEPSSMRRAVANRLLESKQQSPHWYLKIQANMSNFVSFRQEINKMAKIVDGKPEYKISANDIITMAVAKALKKHPDINSSWVNGKIRKYNNIDVSIAVAVGDGIFTPIVKNVDQKGILQISSEIKELVKKAKEGKLVPADYSGGNISISNLGMYGVQEFISIINPPQSCIIAVGAIEDSVVAVSGEVFVSPTCNLFLSADHRVIDGAVLATFASDLRNMLENPALMLL